MHPTTAWLIAFKRAFTASHTSPPPEDNDDLLGLLQAADERLTDGENPSEHPAVGDDAAAKARPKDAFRH